MIFVSRVTVTGADDGSSESAELTHVIRSVHTVVHTHKPVPHTPATRLTADGDAGRRRRESAHRSGHAHLKFDVLGLGGALMRVATNQTR